MRLESQANSVLQKSKVVIWLYDNIEMRVEGTIIVRVQMHVRALALNSSMDEGGSFFIAHVLLRAMSVSTQILCIPSKSLVVLNVALMRFLAGFR